jgi:hypothetical protein
MHPVTFAIKLEQDIPAAKDEKIRVLGDYAVNESLTLEIGELRIRFIRRDRVL